MKKIWVAAALLCSQAWAGEALLLAKDGSAYLPHKAHMLDQERVCLTGGKLIDDEARTHGSLFLIDLKQNKLLWQKVVAPEAEAVSLNFEGCLLWQSSVLGVANETLRTSKQTSAQVFKFDMSGKKLQLVELEVPADNALVLAMGMADGAPLVAGMSQEVQGKDELYGMFYAKLDRDLKVSLKQVKKGGFRSGSSALIGSKGIFLAGQFLPQKLAASASSKDFAHAKTQFNGNYLWSARPLSGKENNALSAFSENGDSYALSWQGTSSYLTRLDANGKVQAQTQYNSKYCEIEHLQVVGEGLLAVRKACAGEGQALLWIDGQGREQELLRPGGKLLAAFAQNGQWYVLQHKDKLHLLQGSLKKDG